MTDTPTPLTLGEVACRLSLIARHAKALEYAIIGADLEDDARDALVELGISHFDRVRELRDELEKQLECKLSPTLERAIRIYKAARAKVEAFKGPGDFPHELSDAETAAIEALARMPCADRAELNAKLEVLSDHDITKALEGGPDLKDGGFVAVAIEAYFDQGRRGWASPNARNAIAKEISKGEKPCR